VVYRSTMDRYVEEIEDAREAVAKAQKAYERGGSCDAVNKANRALADAHFRARECSAGNVRDERQE
jgi:hypothetical protein